MSLQKSFIVMNLLINVRFDYLDFQWMDYMLLYVLNIYLFVFWRWKEVWVRNEKGGKIMTGFSFWENKQSIFEKCTFINGNPLNTEKQVDNRI